MGLLAPICGRLGVWIWEQVPIHGGAFTTMFSFGNERPEHAVQGLGNHLWGHLTVNLTFKPVEGSIGSLLWDAKVSKSLNKDAFWNR